MHCTPQALASYRDICSQLECDSGICSIIHQFSSLEAGTTLQKDARSWLKTHIFGSNSVSSAINPANLPASGLKPGSSAVFIALVTMVLSTCSRQSSSFPKPFLRARGRSRGSHDTQEGNCFRNGSWKLKYGCSFER